MEALAVTQQFVAMLAILLGTFFICAAICVASILLQNRGGRF